MLQLKVFVQEAIFIVIGHNSSYDNILDSLIKYGKLTCDCTNNVISYLMNRRGKVHPIFINNERQELMYMLDVGIYYSMTFSKDKY